MKKTEKFQYFLEEGKVDTLLLQVVLKELRKADPDIKVAILGSGARSQRDTSIGMINSRYKASLNSDKSFSMKYEAPVIARYGRVSDLDLEVISDKLNQTTVDQIMKQVLLSKFFDGLSKIELTCYHPDDIEKYFVNLNSSDISFLVYRFCIADLACLPNDIISTDYFLQLRSKIFSLINEDSVLRHCLIDDGYKSFKQRVKRAMQLAPYENGDLMTTLTQNDGDEAHTYFSLKTATTGQALPPYSVKGTESFKGVYPMPDRRRSDSTQVKDEKRPIFGPPLTAYTDKIHLGQLISVTIEDAYARLQDLKLNFNFQVSGPFWDKKGYTNDNLVKADIAKNTQSVTKKLQKIGINRTKHLADDSVKAQNTMSELLSLWHQMGFLQKDDNGFLLRMGSALQSFGLDRGSANLSTRLSQTVAKYVDESILIPLYPQDQQDSMIHTNTYGGHYLYPTFSLLSLFLQNETDSGLIFCGSNVATQFALPLIVALASKGADPSKLTHVENQLVTDQSGKRFSRFAQIPYLEDLWQEASSAGENLERQSNRSVLRNEESYAFAIKYVLLGLFRADRQPKYDVSKFTIALKNLLKIKKVVHSFKHLKFDYSKITDTKNRVLEDFKSAVNKLDMKQAMLIYEANITILWNEFNKNDVKKESLESIVLMTYILFGQQGIDSIYDL